MSVNYEAVFGTGFRIDAKCVKNNDMEELADYVTTESEGAFRVETKHLCDICSLHYVFISALSFPNLTNQETELIDFCEKHSIGTVGTFGLHGGLSIA